MSSPRLGSRALISSRSAQTALRPMRSVSSRSQLPQDVTGFAGCDGKATACIIVGSSNRLGGTGPMFQIYCILQGTSGAAAQPVDNRVSTAQHFKTSPKQTSSGRPTDGLLA